MFRRTLAAVMFALVMVAPGLGRAVPAEHVITGNAENFAGDRIAVAVHDSILGSLGTIVYRPVSSASPIVLTPTCVVVISSQLMIPPGGHVVHFAAEADATGVKYFGFLWDGLTTSGGVVLPYDRFGLSTQPNTDNPCSSQTSPYYPNYNYETVVGGDIQVTP